ncbi:MAG: lamin tail domain-containing protein [Puniceicoccales bacterium]|jgi:hypothetical protein|nr:lamin tail domain-containing protein [Puniceicoccales bacterium]
MLIPSTFLRSLTAIVALLWCTCIHAQPIVINEINYAPDGVTNTAEFIELYNNSNDIVDLSNWEFNKGVTYTFPAGTTMGPRSYLVITGDMAAFAQGWPTVTAIGPWSGKLANEGELVRLRDSNKNVIDEVEYGVGFPWPTSARGEGPSMELLNPNLDNSLPSSWRSSGNQAASSGPQEYLGPNDPDWRYRKGKDEASNPISAWRELNFVEDNTWLVGQTSIGYGDDDDNTVLTDMQGNYWSIFLRKKFSINPGEVPSAIKLYLRVDDGCVVWINGTEVKRVRMSTIDAAEPAYNSRADNYPNEATDPGPHNFDEFIITNANSFLNEGENIIAIQVFNSALASSDLTIDAKIVEYVAASGGAPTPGAQNSVYTTTAPSIAINEVTQDITQPKPGDAITVTAKFEESSTLDSVKIRYQKVNPGNYIRRTDTGFDSTWTDITMTANGDGTYTGVIPGSVQTHRALIRYQVAASYGTNTVTVPYSDDPEANFAYFVYGEIPEWKGKFDSTSSEVTYSADMQKKLPVYHLIANASDVTNSQYNSGYNGQRFYGTLVYDGVVYDHIRFANRGEGSTYVSGKNKWRIFFHNSKRLAARDNFGNLYESPWDKLNLNGCASPWATVHRGMGGIEEALSFRLYELLGMAASRTHFMHFRVITGSSETASTQYQAGNPNNDYNGDLWGLYLAVENFDGSFLDDRALDDGNIYKIENGGAGDLKHDGDGFPLDGSDWAAFKSAWSNSANNTNAAWWRANFDLDTYYSFHSANRILGNVDLRKGWNHGFYHAPDGRWTVLPWDLDMMFIAKEHQGGLIDQHNCLNVSALNLEFKNRARELLDLVCEDASASGGQIGQLIDEYARFIDDPAGGTATWATLDAAMWNRNPRTRTGDAQTNHFGNFYKTPYTDSRFGGTWVRTLSTANFAGSVKYLVEYATNTWTGGTWAANNGIQYGYGYKYLESEGADSQVPVRPTAPRNVGSAEFTINNLVFGTGAYSGTSSFAAAQYRIAEISAPGIPLHDATKPRIYEVTDVWRSEEITSSTDTVKIPSSAAQAGHTYRVRVRHKDATGRWSRWSPAVQFVAAAMPAISPQELVVSEIMFAPGYPTAREFADPRFESIKNSKDSGTDPSAYKETKEEFEYVEFLNISTRTLDLSDVSFVGNKSGITYTFADGVTLAPNERILLVKNVTGFAIRYGNVGRIAGTYGPDGKFNNNIETFTLSQGGTIIHEFTYDFDTKGTPWDKNAKNTGYSLELISPYDAPDHNVASNWRASDASWGTPGSGANYAEWAMLYPGIGTPLESLTGDGIDNLTKYVLGMNPLASNNGASLGSGSIESLEVSGQTGKYFVFAFTYANSVGDVSRTVEFSTDLKVWTSGGTLVDSTDNGNGTTTEYWRSAQPISENKSLFARLRFQQN